VEEIAHRKPRSLRNTKRDWLIVAAIAVVSTVAVFGAVATAPIRHSVLSPAAETFTYPLNIGLLANDYQQAWSRPGDDFQSRPVVAAGLIISTTTHDGNSIISAINPSNGEEVWRYSRDVALCSLASAWDSVIATYRTGVGCGDVVRIDAPSGTYKHTRSAIAPNDVLPVVSNDRVGIVSDTRLELWRSDLVRTLEYGDVEAKNEPELQPNEDCVISSALTRTDNTAVLETCDGIEWVRLQKTTPEESRSPEVTQDILLSGTGNQLVAINSTGVAVYNPKIPEIISYDGSGAVTAQQPVAPAPLVNSTNPSHAFAPSIADLPHNMTWFDGDRLYLFKPSELSISRVFEDAIGTGVAMGGLLLYPTAEGWNLANWDTGEITRSVAIDRAGYTGSVSLATSGDAVVEKRGTELVALRPAGSVS
jgi:hypothetical protein